MKPTAIAVLLAAALVPTVRPATAQVVPAAASARAAAADPHAGHAMSAAGQAPAGAPASIVGLPPAEDGAKARLNASPRHGEYADVALADGTKLRAWVSYPERKDKAPVVIVIHEIFGL